jgi:hypothetical protein
MGRKWRASLPMAREPSADRPAPKGSHTATNRPSLAESPDCRNDLRGSASNYLTSPQANMPVKMATNGVPEPAHGL